MTTTMEAPATLDVGWHEDVPMETYLAIPALSSSGEITFDRSPAHYYEAQKQPDQDTIRKRLGSALHAALLEPDLFKRRWITLEPCQQELATGKRAGEPCGNPGVAIRDGRSYCGVHDPEKGKPVENARYILPQHEMGKIPGMVAAIQRHPTARRYFEGRGVSELVGIARDPSGALLKIRLDRSIDRAEWIHADVKMCADASPDAFSRHAGRMNYVRKMAFYRYVFELLGREVRASALVAVEDQPPHGVKPYLLDENQIAGFKTQIARNVRRYAECVKRNDWSETYGDGNGELILKPWDAPELPDIDMGWED